MTESATSTARTLSRRRVLVAGAWSVPVIATAVAAPRSAASGPILLELMGATDDALTLEVPVGDPDGNSSDAFYVTVTGTGPIPQNWTAKILGAGIAGWMSDATPNSAGDGIVVPLDSDLLILPFYALKSGSFTLRVMVEGAAPSKDFAITLVVQ